MARWRQKFDPETGKSEFVPIDDAARKQDGIIINRDVEPFRSPIDGTVISTRRQYDDHCRKHNVVPAQEFSQEFYDRKAAERARLYTGERTRQEELASKSEIYEIINHLERRG